METIKKHTKDLLFFTALITISLIISNNLNYARTISLLFLHTGTLFILGYYFGPRSFFVICLATIAAQHLTNPMFYGTESFENYDYLNAFRQVCVYGGGGMLFRLYENRKQPDVYRKFIWLGLSGIGMVLISTPIAMYLFLQVWLQPKDLFNATVSFIAGDFLGFWAIAPLCMIKSLKIAYWRERLSVNDLTIWSSLCIITFSIVWISLTINQYELSSSLLYFTIVPIILIGLSAPLELYCLSCFFLPISISMLMGIYGFDKQLADPQILFSACLLSTGVVCVAFTQRKEAAETLARREAELAHAGRLAALGEMSGTLSHEIATPLQDASINAELLKQRLVSSTAPELRKYSDKVVAAIQRAIDVQRRIHLLAAPARNEVALINIAGACDESLSFLERQTRKENIQIIRDYSDKLGNVLIDPIQLQQVLINILKNAIEAISEQNGKTRPTIRISITEPVSGTIRVEIIDNGPGLSRETDHKLFQSFHSTKPGNLGLGLSISRGIMEKFDGRIRIHPVDPHGTNVQLEFSKC